MEIIFHRYGRLEKEEESSLEDAKKMLWAIEEGGSGYAVGIYDNVENKFYYADNSIIGQDLNCNLEMKKIDLERLNIYPAVFELYKDKSPH